MSAVTKDASAKRRKSFIKWANAEFAPAHGEELARMKPPSPDEWDQMKNPYLVSLRIAYRMVQLDKSAHVAALNALTPEDSGDLSAHLEKCADRFRCLADLAEGALDRLVCAGAKIELERGEEAR
jgi:hypothetical protein